MFVFIVFIAASLTAISAADPDVVNERLTMQPLKNGDWLLVLDLSIISKGYEISIDRLSYPGVMMDTMPIDIFKLYVKSAAEWFGGNISLGEWKHFLWGRNRFPLLTSGSMLFAKWLNSDKERSYEHFETLCYGLWGITGSVFSNMINADAFIHDLTDLLNVENPPKGEDDSRIYASTDGEEIVCADNLYKWRYLMPCMAHSGLSSLINDERLFVRAPYKGISFFVEGDQTSLTFKSRVQFIVPESKFSGSIWEIFPNRERPLSCPSVTSSSVDFIIARSHQGLFGEFKFHDEVLSLKFPDIDEKEESNINSVFERLRMLMSTSLEHIDDREILYEVAELESLKCDTLKRVQSSLSIRLENVSSRSKYIRVQQPLPYWMVPQISGLTIKIVSTDSEKGERVIYECESSDCFQRNPERLFRTEAQKAHDTTTKETDKADRGNVTAKFSETLRLPLLDNFAFMIQSKDYGTLKEDPRFPLIIYKKMLRWTIIGFSVELDAKTKCYLRVDLQKNNMEVEDIHVSAHRGQLIPSGIILELNSPDSKTDLKGHNLDFDNPMGEKMHFLGSFFSYFTFPDTTMTFNVMASSGIVIGIFLGIALNTFSANWTNKV